MKFRHLKEITPRRGRTESGEPTKGFGASQSRGLDSSAQQLRVLKVGPAWFHVTASLVAKRSSGISFDLVSGVPRSLSLPAGPPAGRWGRGPGGPQAGGGHCPPPNTLYIKGRGVKVKV